MKPCQLVILIIDPTARLKTHLQLSSDSRYVMQIKNTSDEATSINNNKKSTRYKLDFQLIRIFMLSHRMVGKFSILLAEDSFQVAVNWPGLYALMGREAIITNRQKRAIKETDRTFVVLLLVHFPVHPHHHDVTRPLFQNSLPVPQQRRRQKAKAHPK